MNTKKMPRAAEAGFTLVGLVVVVLILVILAAVVVPVIGDKVDNARVASVKSAMNQIGAAFIQYHVDTNAWPSNTPTSFVVSTAVAECYGYECLYKNTGNKANWDGPYLNDGMVDGGRMQVAVQGKTDGILDPWNRPFWVYSYAEGFDGGQGAIVLLDAGQNGIVDSTAADVYADSPEGDDHTFVVTRNLSFGLEK